MKKWIVENKEKLHDLKIFDLYKYRLKSPYDEKILTFMFLILQTGLI